MGVFLIIILSLAAILLSICLVIDIISFFTGKVKVSTYIGLESILYKYLKDKVLKYDGIEYDLEKVFIERGDFSYNIYLELKSKKTDIICKTNIVNVTINERGKK